MKTIRKSLLYVLPIIWLLVVLGVAFSIQIGETDWRMIGIEMAICGVLPVVVVAGIRWVAQQISLKNRAARVSETGIQRYLGFIFGVILILGCGAIGLVILGPLLSPSVPAECTYVEGGTDCGQLTISNTSSSSVDLELIGTFTFNGGTPKDEWGLNGSSDVTVSIRPGTYRVVARCGLARDELEDVTVPAGGTSSIRVFGIC